jgi:hypothetical protein
MNRTTRIFFVYLFFLAGEGNHIELNLMKLATEKNVSPAIQAIS